MKSTFRIDIATSGEEGNWSATGIDQVIYMIATNPGEPMRQLEHIASGGELSRVMLALKVSVEEGVTKAPSSAKPKAPASPPNARWFSTKSILESVAARPKPSAKMKFLARSNQVLCVTHLPQIATFADHHYVIEKKERTAAPAPASARWPAKSALRKWHVCSAAPNYRYLPQTRRADDQGEWVKPDVASDRSLRPIPDPLLIPAVSVAYIDQKGAFQ